MIDLVAPAAGRPDVIGRQSSLAELGAVLSRPGPGATAVTLSGPAGIGKTTLLREAVRLAADAGAHVLEARPALDERDLSYAGLADLLRPISATILDALPEPERAAMDVALLRTAPGAATGDWRSVAQATLDVMRALLRTAPVLIVVDDEPWLDRSTARVVSFALRRLADERVTLLAARRAAADEDAGSVADALDSRVIELGPLPATELGRVIRHRLGVALPLPAVTRLHAVTGGNPFYALLLAEEWLRVGVPRDETLPLPRRLRDIVRDRLAGLSDEALELLVIASAVARPDLGLIQVVVGDPKRVELGLEEAEELGIIALRGQAIEFTHPLLASGAYSGASAPSRRRLHRRLAEVMTDEEDVARHLAAATLHADGATAAAIEAGARHAAARGSPDAAAALYEEAARITPAGAVEDARRRLLAAAAAHASAGDTARARGMLERVVEVSPGGAPRADALNRLAAILTRSHGVEQAVAAWSQALEDAPADSVLAGDIHDNLAWYVCWLGDTTGAHRHALEAQRLAELNDEEPLHVRAITKVAMLEFQLGRGMNRPVLERAASVERATTNGSFEADGILIQHLTWSDDLEEARSRAVGLLAEAGSRGDVGHQIDALYYLVSIEYGRGDWDVAERYADDVAERAAHAGADFLAAVIGAWQGLIIGSRGRFDEARPLLEHALSVVSREQHRWMELRCLGSLSFIELCAGDLPRAREYGLRTAVVARAIDVPEPGIFHVVPDAIEALIATGELAVAGERLAELQQQAESTGRRWALGAAARCRGLLLASDGRVDEALDALDESVRVFRALPYPFELGRSLLATGAGHRRSRHKQHARALLDEAAAIFDRLGAPTWRDRARAEQDRIDGRAPSVGDGLTATEQQVAVLVAAGGSNQEVARELFISVRTVESNLTRIYQKLGVRSRTQLSRVLSD